jgi:hypothetical protein
MTAALRLVEEVGEVHAHMVFVGICLVSHHADGGTHTVLRNDWAAIKLCTNPVDLSRGSPYILELDFPILVRSLNNELCLAWYTHFDPKGSHRYHESAFQSEVEEPHWFDACGSGGSYRRLSLQEYDVLREATRVMQKKKHFFLEKTGDKRAAYTGALGFSFNKGSLHQSRNWDVGVHPGL